MKKILIIRYKKSLGDTLIVSSLSKTLKEYYNNAIIHYLVYENFSEIFENHKYIDKVVVLDRNEKIKNYLKTLFYIKKEKYDIIIDCRSIYLTSFLVLFSGAKIKIGKYNKWRQIFYDYNIKGFEKNNINQIEKYHLLLKCLKINKVSTNYNIYISQKEKKEWEIIMRNQGIDFNRLIFPMTVTGRRNYKIYPRNYMKILIKKLIEIYNCQIIFIFSPEEEEDIKTFYDELNLHKNIFPHLKTHNLRELGAVLSNCDLFIGNEGGARHLAESVGLPNFSIIAPTTNKSEWIINDNSKNLTIDIKEVNGKNYLDIKPQYVLEKIHKQLKEFNYFSKLI